MDQHLQNKILYFKYVYCQQSVLDMSVQTIGGFLAVWSMPGLLDLGGLGGISGELHGGLAIGRSPKLQSLAGIGPLTYVDRDLELHSLDKLREIPGLEVTFLLYSLLC